MSRLPVLLLFLPAIGCSSEPAAPAGSVPPTPQFTMGSGVTRNDLAQATFDIDKVKRITDKWHVELKAEPGLEIAVRRFDYAPSSETVVTNTGWHRHPGPVFIQVVAGTVTFYEADDPNCTPIVVHAGEAYLDLGEHGHIGRNETNQLAQDVTVLFGPPGIAPADFRIDMTPAPGNCPF
jgi:quercetin dioxygenase-like cupin family protein